LAEVDARLSGTGSGADSGADSGVDSGATRINNLAVLLSVLLAAHHCHGALV